MNYQMLYQAFLAVFDHGLKYRNKFELHDWKWLTMLKKYNRVIYEIVNGVSYHMRKYRFWKYYYNNKNHCEVNILSLIFSPWFEYNNISFTHFKAIPLICNVQHSFDLYAHKIYVCVVFSWWYEIFGIYDPR